MRTFILGLFLLAWLAVVLWAAGSPLISPSASASASFVAPAMARTFVQAPCLMPRKPGLPALSPARQAMLERARRRGVNQPPPPQAPLTGTMKGILLLIDFSDNVGTTSPDHFEDLIFSKGTYSTGSLRDYYLEASYGQFDVQGDVLKKWLRAPQSYSYYTNKGAGLGNYPQNAQKMVEDAVQLADPDVDFSQYDNDGDGTVEYLLVVHAGPGAETRLFDPGDHIWSHYHVLNQPLTVDNVKVYPYVIMPEDGNIGVFCHESGHAFGLPDLYDTDNSSQGIGFWGLMSAGAWGNNGVTPVHPCAWSKVQWGWVSPTAPSQNLNDETIPPVETNKAIYRLWTDGNTSNKQYFLVENRQATKFDQYIPGSGLLIYHIDDEVTGGNRDNSREWYPGHTDSGHYRVAIEQADGRWDLEKNKNYGDDSDPWPGSGNKTEFNASSTPNSRDYAGNDTKVAVEDIRTSGSDVIADLKVTTGGAGTTYKISGKVTTSSGAGISGVTVKAEKDGSVKGQATTASNGGYQITDLAAGTYTVTPSKQNYTFNPSSRQVTVGPDQTAVNFVGSTEQRNNPPTLKNGSVSPSTGNVSTTFTYKVTYTDADNDAPSYVRVYIDGQAYDMNKDPKDNTYTDGVVYTYDKTNLAKGSHKYHFEASDGKDTARLPSSGDTDGPTVQNRPPSASNVKITPTSPKAGQALTANYTFDDPDGDAESGTQIRWYRNGVVQSSLNDKQVVPTGTTKAGEQWRFTVKPSDGTDFGTEQKSNTVVIGEGDGEDLNNPPTVSNVKITPASPVEGDALTANYTYSDPDGDAESGTQIRWYRNGVLRAAYNDQTTLPANTTRAGERWYFTVRPKDGKDFGPQKKSGTVIVKVKQVPNDPPRASDLSITPSQPKAGDALTGSYTYSDPNGDAESGTQIRWYRNGAVVSAYNDRTTVPSGVTKEGEEWYFTVRPKDGRDFGQVQQSPKVTVAAAGGVTNDPPTATNLRIVPAKPKAGWKLTVQYKYSDPNNDPEGNTQIRWFKDGVLQGDYNNKQVLPAGVTQAGEQWHCTVKPHDGKDFGTVRASGAVTIQATGGAGDFSGDGRVDLTDLEQFRAHWGRKQGDADFEARFDLTGDGIVNLDDFWAFWANNDLDPTDRNNVLHTTWTHGDVTGPGPTDESGLGAPDDVVDFHDLLVFAQAWQSAAGEANWQPLCDFAKAPHGTARTEYPFVPNDNKVDFNDLLIFAQNWHRGDGTPSTSPPRTRGRAQTGAEVLTLDVVPGGSTQNALVVQNGSEVTVNLLVSNAEDFSACNLLLDFNTNVLTFKSGTQGDFWTSAGAQVFFDAALEGTNGVRITGAILGPNASKCPDGSGVIAALTFTVKAAGASRLAWSETTLTAFNSATGLNESFNATSAVDAVLMTADDLAANQLLMIGLPFTPTDADIGAVLSEIASTQKAATWDAEHQRYRLYSDEAQSFTYGYGAWVKLQQDTSLGGTAGTVDLTQPAEVSLVDNAGDLAKGFTQVANPWPVTVAKGDLKVRYGGSTVNWSQAVANGWVRDEITTYDGANQEYIIPTQLEPFKSYWFKAYVDCTLIVPVPDINAASEGAPPKAASLPQGWQFDLVAQSGQHQSRVTLGAVKGASRLADRYDLERSPQPPTTPPNRVEINLLPPEGGLRAGPYRRDLRPLGSPREVWEVEVGRVPVGEEIILSAPNLRAVPGDYEVQLVDLTTQRIVSLRTRQHYTYQATEPRRRFQVRLQRREGPGVQVLNLRATRSRGAGMTFRYEITQPAEVTVEVYSLNGRQVAVVSASRQSGRGTQVVPWNGYDTAGRPLPNGLYLCQVTARTTRGEMARALLPFTLVR